jgi:hypothetical protein
MSSNISEILNLPREKIKLKNVNEITDIYDLEDIFLDGEYPISYRIESINKLYNLNTDSAKEIVIRIIGFFSLTFTYNLQELLISVVNNSNIDLYLKLECSKVLYENDKFIGYTSFIKLLNIIETSQPDFPIPLKVQIYSYLFESSIHYDMVTKSFKENIIYNSTIEDSYRYEILMSLQKNECLKIYLISAYLDTIQNTKIMSKYRILSSQYILSSKDSSVLNKEVAQSLCEDLAKDKFLDYGLRAEAADILLRLSINKSGKELGKEIITLLGQNKESYTIYNNKQNVHVEEIDASIKDFLLFLSSIETKLNSDGNIPKFKDIQIEIENIAKSLEFIDKIFIEYSEDELKEVYETENERKSAVINKKIKSSLYRIFIDNSLYSGNQTLSGITIKIWQLIQSHENKDLLEWRLCEELIESFDTCTSGHLSRLINTFSSFEFNLNIGWKNQIESNVFGRLNKKIKDIEDETVRDSILDQMSWTTRLEERYDFNNFFRLNLNSIRDELYSEFVGEKYISHDEFEEYFRSAIMKFEG